MSRRICAPSLCNHKEMSYTYPRPPHISHGTTKSAVVLSLPAPVAKAYHTPHAACTPLATDVMHSTGVQQATLAYVPQQCVPVSRPVLDVCTDCSAACSRSVQVGGCKEVPPWTWPLCLGRKHLMGYEPLLLLLAASSACCCCSSLSNYTSGNF